MIKLTFAFRLEGAKAAAEPARIAAIASFIFPDILANGTKRIIRIIV